MSEEKPNCTKILRQFVSSEVLKNTEASVYGIEDVKLFWQTMFKKQECTTTTFRESYILFACKTV